MFFLITTTRIPRGKIILIFCFLFSIFVLLNCVFVTLCRQYYVILAITRCVCYTTCVNFHIDPSYPFCACGCQTSSHSTIGGLFVQRQKPIRNHPLSGWFSDYKNTANRRDSLLKRIVPPVCCRHASKI